MLALLVWADRRRLPPWLETGRVFLPLLVREVMVQSAIWPDSVPLMAAFEVPRVMSPLSSSATAILALLVLRVRPGAESPGL